MDTITFIRDSVDQVQLRLMGTCDGLTQEQVEWRPAPYANNIGFILWHVARGEDRMIGQLSGAGVDLWESEGWYKRFGQPVEMPDPGDRMGLRSLAIPSLDTLIGYLGASHKKTSGYLATLSVNSLAEIPETYPRGVVSRTGPPPPRHPQEQPPRPGRFSPRPAGPGLGPPSRHRHDPPKQVGLATPNPSDPPHPLFLVVPDSDPVPMVG